MAKKIKLETAEAAPVAKDEKAQRRETLKNTIELIKDLQRLLQTGRFPGQKAPLIIGAIRWLQSIHDQCKDELNASKD